MGFLPSRAGCNLDVVSRQETASTETSPALLGQSAQTKGWKLFGPKAKKNFMLCVRPRLQPCPHLFCLLVPSIDELAPAAGTKQPRLGGSPSRLSFSLSSGGWTSEMKVLAGLVSPRPFPSACGCPSSRSPGLSRVCVCVLVSPNTDTVLLDWGAPIWHCVHLRSHSEVLGLELQYEFGGLSSAP